MQSKFLQSLNIGGNWTWILDFSLTNDFARLEALWVLKLNENSYHGTKILEFSHLKVADRRLKSQKLESIQQSKWNNLEEQGTLLW